MIKVFGRTSIRPVADAAKPEIFVVFLIHVYRNIAMLWVVSIISVKEAAMHGFVISLPLITHILKSSHQ